MSKKFIPYVVIVDIIIVAALVWYFVTRDNEEKLIHHHAGFQVYENGVLKDFSDLRYMHIEPCGLLRREDDQIEKAHLHNNVGDVVHVDRENAQWGDLLKNLNYPLPTSTEFVGYLNGERREDILTYPILPYDSVVFFSGKIEGMNQKLQARVTDVRMKEAEQQSEDCGNK